MMKMTDISNTATGSRLYDRTNSVAHNHRRTLRHGTPTAPVPVSGTLRLETRMTIAWDLSEAALSIIEAYNLDSDSDSVEFWLYDDSSNYPATPHIDFSDTWEPIWFEFKHWEPAT